jgi:hypothetical protein
MWTVADLAQEVRRSLANQEPTGDTLRLVRQFIMDLQRSDDPMTMFRDEPSSTGERKWDALIAGTIEDFALHRGIEPPSWVFQEQRYLSTWWFLTSIDPMRPTAIVQAPAALSRRGVFVQRASLVNA